jgi:hypothetical protein
MPTVFDSLRRHLLGDEAAEMLQLSLDILTARALSKSEQHLQRHGARPNAQRDLHHAPTFIAEWDAPSYGYEPLLIEMGWERSAARAVAKFVIRRSKKHAEESRIQSQVYRDIRFLAKRPRRRETTLHCARRLYQAAQDTAVVGDLVYNSGVNDFEFVRLLESIVKGPDADYRRLLRLCRTIACQLSQTRGPKRRAASIAHEFFLTPNFGLKFGPWPASRKNDDGEYVSALTAATREEFGALFDPRPAQRRVARNRLKSHKE